MTAPGPDEALAKFEASRDAFTSAYGGVPDEALAFLKPGDDYALGGLITHVVAVLEHYHLVLGAVVEAGFAEVRPEDPPGFWEEAGQRCRVGLQPGQRAEAFDELDRRHDDFAAAVRSLPAQDWDRKAPVWFGTAAEPLPTSPADIWGWLDDHYAEHVPQVHQLLDDWQSSR